MSLGKIAERLGTFEEYKGLSIEQIKAKMLERFYEAYGRYENVSGTMWVEITHKGGADYTQGEVVWRKGTIGKDELDEDVILEREAAVRKLMKLMQKGYTEVFKAITQEDLDKHNNLRLERQSTAKREGWLGTYYRNKEFIRFSEFVKDDIYIERGYGDSTLEATNESVGSAKVELDVAYNKGFRKEGEEVDVFTNPLAIFGIELDSIDAIEHKAKEAIKPKEGDLSNDLWAKLRGEQ